MSLPCHARAVLILLLAAFGCGDEAPSEEARWFAEHNVALESTELRVTLPVGRR